MPPAIRTGTSLDLPAALSEAEALAALRQLADRNEVFTSLIGMGYSGTVTPGVILRNVLENPAWYTAYTPYQPEISQGRLEVLLNYQTMVADLTGMDLANASLLDEATAAAEAMAMARRLAPKAGSTFFVDRDCHPQTIAVVETRARPLGIDVVVGDPVDDLPFDGLFGALLQYPGSSGALRDDTEIVERVHAQDALVTVATDLLALCLLRPPGEIGADIVVGSAQRFGVPLGYGGPHAAFLACRDAHKRTLPGRLVGVSVDSEGRPALRLALQTREQHIRREKATSNICTAQVLLAVISGLYAQYHGPDGLRAIASRVHDLTATLAAGLDAGGRRGADRARSSTRSRCGYPAARRKWQPPPRQQRINLPRGRRRHARHRARRDHHSRDGGRGAGRVRCLARPATSRHPVPPSPPRCGAPASSSTHPVFHEYRSETQMLRYLRRLADLDLALDRTMIPLGSCTMKLNATTEMMPITWPEFGQLHPFAPLDQTAGYQELFSDLERWLCEITGYAAVSLQPNAGSQGELAGLLAIRAYHRGAGRRAPRGVPHPRIGARHERGERGDGRDARRGGRDGCGRERRSRRPRRRGRRSTRNGWVR